MDRDAPAGGRFDPAEGGKIERSALRALDAHDYHGALTLLMDGFGGSVYGYCLKMVREPQDAQDMLTATFTDAFRSLESFQRRSSLRTWLFGIAHHRCLDFLRARQRDSERYEPLVRDPPVDPVSPDELAEKELRRLQLDRCLRSLTHRTRSTLVLRFSLGFSYPEMADLTGERPATLQARVARALPALRECLVRHGVTS